MEKDSSNTNILLHDLSNSMNEKFNLVFKEFAGIKTTLVTHESRLTALQEVVQNTYTDQQMLKAILHSHDNRFTEILDELDILSKAFDKDAVTLVQHEERISVLEGKKPALSTTD
jgi:hypothetical protein